MRIRLVLLALVLAAGAWGQPTIGGVLDNATFVGDPSSLSYAAIFGTGYGDTSAIASTTPQSTELNGVRVTFNGEPGAMFVVSPMQLAVQVPATFPSSALTAEGEPKSQPSGPVQIVVESPTGMSAPFDGNIRPASPGIWTPTQNGMGQGWVLYANSNIVAAPTSQNDFFIGLGQGGSRPAVAGDVLTIFASGLGEVDPPIGTGEASCDAVPPDVPLGQCLPDFSNLNLRTTVITPRVIVGGVEVPAEDILFSGLAAQFVGLYQINFRMPAGVAAGDAVVIQIIVGEETSPDTVTIAAG